MKYTAPYFNFLSNIDCQWSIMPSCLSNNESLKILKTYFCDLQVFSCSFTTILFSPVFGKYIDCTGSKNLFLLGTFIAGVANISFGFLQWVDKTSPFLALSIITRLISAMGEAASSTAIFPITINVSTILRSIFIINILSS